RVGHRRLVQAVRLPLVGRQEGVEPAHAFLLIDPVDPVSDLGRCFEVLSEAAFDQEDRHTTTPSSAPPPPYTVHPAQTARRCLPAHARGAEGRLRHPTPPPAASAAPTTPPQAVPAGRCCRDGVSGTARSAPRRRARLSAISLISWPWFQLNAGRATGASRFI